VPEVQSFRGKFVYNFFVRDELFNVKGSKRFQGSLEVITDGGKSLLVDNFQNAVEASVMQSETARFVELDFSPSTLTNGSNIGDMSLGEEGFLKKHVQLINEETSMNSPIDAAVSRSDPHLRRRLVQKLKILASLARDENNPVSNAQQLLGLLEETDEVDSKIAEGLLSGLSFVDLGFVNEINQIDRSATFLKASLFKNQSNIDRRVGSMIFNPVFSKKSRMVQVADKFAEDSSKNFEMLREESQSANFELDIKVLPGKQKLEENSSAANLDFQATTAGYIVERLTVGHDGLFSASKKRIYYLDGEQRTKLIDTQVIYGGSYAYTVSAVYAINFTETVPDDPKTTTNEAGTYRFLALVKSKKSKPLIIDAVENKPPAEPDGVLYRYNYDAGTGLLINWQMPAGKQRDIKYFQVFRRRNIKEPFTCIAELDFNDVKLSYGSKKIKPPERTEKISQDRIYKFNFPRTFFNDARFDRRSKFIYAIAAVDAHGLTSAYSAQTEVGFDRIKNKITLSTISRPGAPKQYPNFFIDPSLDNNFMVDSLTTDVMLSSKKQSIEVFFDPDCITAEIKASDTSPLKKQAEKIRVVKSKNREDAEYVLNILNIDRQKSKNFTLKVQNVRKPLADESGDSTAAN